MTELRWQAPLEQIPLTRLIVLFPRLLRGLNSVGWAYEALSRPAPRIKAEIEKLEARQAAYWGGIVNTTSTFEASLVDPDLPPMFSEEDLQAMLSLPVEEYALGGWQAGQGTTAMQLDGFGMMGEGNGSLF